MDATTARRPAEHALVPALERGLDALAEQVRGDVEPAAFFRGLLQLLVHTARVDEAVLWLRTAEETWNRYALTVEAPDGMPVSRGGVAGPAWLASALAAEAPQLARFHEGDRERQRIAVAVRQGGAPAGVLEVVCEFANLPAPLNTLASFCSAVSEVAGDFLVQQELRLLRRERAEWKQWDQWLNTLLATDDWRRLAALLSHDGRALTGSDRVTILRLKRGAPRVVSISGVDEFDPRSNSVQALERFALAAVQLRQDLWCGRDDTCPAAAATAWSRLQQAAGTVQAAALLIRGGGGWLTGVLVCERFDARPETGQWPTRCDTLRRFTAGPWSAAMERAAGIWSRLWSHSQQRLSPWERTVQRAVWSAALLTGAALALTYISTDLVVTGEGQLLPAERRDIFATANGIVDQVHVQHGATVQPGSPLVVLRDPVLELEATRIAGELATARARLSVVQAARISGSGVALDPVSRAQQLTGEEEELRQRIETLGRQYALLEQERQSWTLKSPIAGQVLTWNVEPLLAGRPVQRGDVLLEVGNTGGDWVVEIRLRERDAGPVMAAWNHGRNTVPVEFVPLAGPRFKASGVVHEIARVTELDDRGESTVRLLATVDRSQVPDLRPGKTVLPRLSCGRHPLGYVWFRDLINAVRRMWWQWH
uniref:HlyD family efflux transporter periplasmic adaptor subunit n=1 Tax=Schlesneria paludicola TaxID=360056 RepID=A0A7C4LMV2_9PLAN